MLGWRGSVSILIYANFVRILSDLVVPQFEVFSANWPRISFSFLSFGGCIEVRFPLAGYHSCLSSSKEAEIAHGCFKQMLEPASAYPSGLSNVCAMSAIEIALFSKLFFLRFVLDFFSRDMTSRNWIVVTFGMWFILSLLQSVRPRL